MEEAGRSGRERKKPQQRSLPSFSANLSQIQMVSHTHQTHHHKEDKSHTTISTITSFPTTKTPDLIQKCSNRKNSNNPLK
jgi:alpha-D-ribose 1-methylphosphonate 5-triphosphate diphosphatase PhnM